MDSEQRPKYLAIRNWTKFQHLDHGTAARWCKIHTSILDDPDMMTWSWSLRGVWSWLILLRSRVGHNLPSDPVILRRMLGGDPVQASVVHRSISVLESLGYIFFTCNKYEENIPEDSRTREEKSESREEKKKHSGVRTRKARVVAPAIEHFHGQKLIITEPQHLTFVASFGHLDLESQYREMDCWLVSNANGYTAFGKFALRWLKREPAPGRNGNGRPKLFSELKEEKRARDYAKTRELLGLPPEPPGVLPGFSALRNGGDVLRNPDERRSARTSAGGGALHDGLEAGKDASAPPLRVTRVPS